MADSPDKSRQQGQASTQQCHASDKMFDGVAVFAERYLVLVLVDGSQIA
jgi:hypothetical protein